MVFGKKIFKGANKKGSKDLDSPQVPEEPVENVPEKKPEPEPHEPEPDAVEIKQETRAEPESELGPGPDPVTESEPEEEPERASENESEKEPDEQEPEKNEPEKIEPEKESEKEPEKKSETTTEQAPVEELDKKAEKEEKEPEHEPELEPKTQPEPAPQPDPEPQPQPEPAMRSDYLHPVPLPEPVSVVIPTSQTAAHAEESRKQAAAEVVPSSIPISQLSQRFSGSDAGSRNSRSMSQERPPRVSGSGEKDSGRLAHVGFAKLPETEESITRVVIPPLTALKKTTSAISRSVSARSPMISVSFRVCHVCYMCMVSMGCYRMSRVRWSGIG